MAHSNDISSQSTGCLTSGEFIPSLLANFLQVGISSLRKTLLLVAVCPLCVASLESIEHIMSHVFCLFLVGCRHNCFDYT